jgi:2-amino-4-hydroxy-6-hydroxymethyldihydropteridine diphosphokinase
VSAAWIALGSNLGDRLLNLEKAREALVAEGFRIEAISPVYETEPVGPPQPRYLNQVLRGRWAGAPGELLRRLKGIERRLGRRPAGRWGPRVVDLDILLWGPGGQVRVREEGLEIPHPRLLERPFVLVPLRDIDPQLRLAPEGISPGAVLARLPGWQQAILPYPLVTPEAS